MLDNLHLFIAAVYQRGILNEKECRAVLCYPSLLQRKLMANYHAAKVYGKLESADIRGFLLMEISEYKMKLRPKNAEPCLVEYLKEQEELDSSTHGNGFGRL